MQVTTERQENCIVKLTIEVDERSTNNYMQRAARALSRRYRMPGFRPGKAPYNVVVQRLGVESVQAQVVEQFGDQIFEEGLKESELEPATQASLEEVTWDPTLALHLTLPVQPEVKLGAYRDIRIPCQVAEVTDEDLDAALARLQRAAVRAAGGRAPGRVGRSDRRRTSRPQVEGETVLENTGREIVLDAESPYPVPGFAEAVVGMQVDETREFTLTYPEDHYNKDIAGKEGHFEVRVSEIRAEVLPELDDEFAIMVGDYEDLADLKVKLRQSLQEEAKNSAEQAFEEALWQALIETAEIEYPEVYVDRETEMMQNQFAATMQRQGLDIETFFQLTNNTEEKWRAEIRPQAVEQMKRRLILAEIVKTLELTVEAEEIQAEIEETLEPMGEQADSMRELLESENGRLSIEDGLLRQKALDHLKTFVRVEVEETEPETEAAAGEPAEPQADAAEAVAEAEEPVEAQAPATETEPEAPEAQSEPETKAETASEANEDAQDTAAAELDTVQETAPEVEQDAETAVQAED